MQSRKIGYLLSILLLFLGLIPCASASTTTVTFHGNGVTINLEFPEEAHPNATLTHNVTLTAHTDLSLQYFELFIYAPINTTWQEVKNRTITWDFLENETLTSRIEFQLPQNTNGTLYCEMTAQTDQNLDYLYYSFYTTRVSELTFSEMRNLYNEMLVNYTILQADYELLLDEYNDLLDNYSSLLADYTALLSEHNELLTKYDAQVANYESLLGSYNKLSGDHQNLNSDYQFKLNQFNALQVSYDSLNSTHFGLQANYTTLEVGYNELNQTCTELKTDLNDLQQDITFSENALNNDRIIMFMFVVAVAILIALIIYIKRKDVEPYLVIRKETVAINPDENP